MILLIVHGVALVTWAALTARDASSRTLAGEAASLEAIARVLAPRYEPLLTNNLESDLQALLDSDTRETGLVLMIARRNAPAMVAADAAIRDPENAWFRSEVSRAARSHEFAYRERRMSSERGGDRMWGAWPIEIDGQVNAVLTLSSPLHVGTAPRSIVTALILLGVVSLTIMFVVIVLARARLRRSVDRLLDATHAYAQQDLSYRTDQSNMDELEPVAASLNEMAHEIGNHVLLLHARRNEQEAIMQSMGSGVIALDPDGRVLNLNRTAATILGGSTDESRGRLLHEITRQPELHEFVERAISKREPTKGEIRIHDQFPPTVLEVRSKALLDARNRAAGLLIILEDITELRRLERIRSDFAANVSHELRTPITNIKGYLETIDEIGFDDEDQSRRFLSIIQTNTDRLGSIIEDLLALAHLESREREQHVHPTRTPVQPIVAAAIDQVREDAERKQIEIVSEVAPDIEIVAVAQLIEQALSNLLSNAIKYSPAATTVTVSAELNREGMACIAVSDQGPGISSEHHERLFERFYRVDKARSRALGGTGLGLAIVKHIAQVHGGVVTLESELGAGSTFRIILPAADQAASDPGSK